MKIAIVEGKWSTFRHEGEHIEQKILGPQAEINWYGLLRSEEYGPALSEAHAVIVRPGTPFPREMIFCLKKARVIVSIGVGYDHIDLEAAGEKDIPVCNVPDYCIEEVADATIAMILAHQRKVFLFNYRASLNPLEWDWKMHMPISRSKSLQVGIIGLGRIGTAVALRLKNFGYRIIFFDPYVARGIEKSLNIERAINLNDLLRSSDVITLHIPLNRETAGMVNEYFLGILKPRIILINTARGGIFQDPDVVHKFLRERPESRIGSDVWPDEPPKEHPLIEAWIKREAWLGDRLILTPHSAFYSEESTREVRILAAEIVKTVLNGGKPYNLINNEGL